MKYIQKQQNGQYDNSEKKSYMKPSSLVKSFLFGVGITNDSKKNILEYILYSLKNSGKAYYIVTPNPEIVVAAQKNNIVLQSLNEATIALPDGVGLTIGAHILGVTLQEQIRGIDFMEELLRNVANWPINVGFLGGKPGVAEKAAECLLKKYPKLKIVFAGSDSDKLLTLSKSRMPQLLFVAFGAPKQEIWMHTHVGKINVGVLMGVGGAFDQIVDPSLRPPKFFFAIGLGWLYRLIRQPWRIKRQKALLEFIAMVITQMLQLRK